VIGNDHGILKLMIAMMKIDMIIDDLTESELIG
jgi:hypothetical protein